MSKSFWDICWLGIAERTIQDKAIFCQNIEARPPWDLFINEFSSWPANVIPPGMKLEIIRLEETGLERFHDRFVMTELGGAYLPDGLDEETNPAPGRGRATLLSRDDYIWSWDVYKQDTRDFRIDGRMVLTGI